MYGKYSKKAKKPVARRRRVYRRGVRKTIAPMETCVVRETTDKAFPLQANQAYFFETSLSSFPRALDIADNFQEYRIKSLEFKYIPTYDTFAYTGSVSVGQTLPYLYVKQLTVPPPATFDLSFLKVMGAKPRRLDDKNITLKYAPRINQLSAAANLNNGGVRGLVSPWISTHIPSATTMDDTLHYGHATFIDTYLTSAQMPEICQLELVVVFEFRKPWDKTASTPPPDTAPAIVWNGKSAK